MFRGIRIFADTFPRQRLFWERAADWGLNIIVGFLERGLDAADPSLLTFIEDHPHASFVISRLGLNVYSSADAMDWRRIDRLISLPNAYFQLASMHNREKPPFTVTATVAARFAARLRGSRLVFGSGFPAHTVDGVLAAPEDLHATSFALLRSGALGIPVPDVGNVLGVTPLKLWFSLWRNQRKSALPYVITSPCIDVNDRSCLEVCPADCIYEGLRKQYINPSECIDCGACETECPVEAIRFDRDISEGETQFIADNANFFNSVLPGQNQPIGNPGGATNFGAVGVDTDFVAAWPLPGAG